MTLILIPAMRTASTKLVREIVGGEPYEYYPVGRYAVIDTIRLVYRKDKFF